MSASAVPRPRFLVTAGNTREKIDQVRDWGNIFTGNTGLSIAKALTAAGEVDLLTSNRAHLNEIADGGAGANPIRASAFGTHAELKGALAALMSRQQYDAVFMTAAVADYLPERTYEIIERTPASDGRETWLVRDAQAGKIKSSYARIAIAGTPSEKIIDLFRSTWNFRGLLVKFKLEVGISPEELRRIGHASRIASGADYLVANTLAMVDGPAAGAYLLSKGPDEWTPRAELPARLLRLVLEHARE